MNYEEIKSVEEKVKGINMKRAAIGVRPSFTISYSLFTVFLLFTIHCSLFTSSEASQDIGALLRNYLKNNYPWAEIEMSDLTLSPGMPDGLPERIRVEKGPPHRTVFLLEFNNGRTVTAVVNVKALDRVVMSRRAYGKGYHLQEDDVYTTLMDVTRIPKDAVKSAERIVGRPLTRSIVANIPLADTMVSETAGVKRGRKVTLVAESRGINITTTGELKENGFVGNYVKAVNLSSKKTVAGVLVDENTVKVNY